MAMSMATHQRLAERAKAENRPLYFCSAHNSDLPITFEDPNDPRIKSIRYTVLPDGRVRRGRCDLNGKPVAKGAR